MTILTPGSGYKTAKTHRRCPFTATFSHVIKFPNSRETALFPFRRGSGYKPDPYAAIHYIVPSVWAAGRPTLPFQTLKGAPSKLRLRGVFDLLHHIQPCTGITDFESKVYLLTLTEITGGAPLLEKREKWPPHPPTPLSAAAGRNVLLTARGPSKIRIRARLQGVPQVHSYQRAFRRWFLNPRFTTICYKDLKEAVAGRKSLCRQATSSCLVVSNEHRIKQRTSFVR